MREEMLDFMWRSGLVRQSVDRMIPLLDRWEGFLRSWGVTTIPPLGIRDYTYRTALAHNLLNLLIRQGAQVRDKAIEHRLRNLVGVRPYKV